MRGCSVRNFFALFVGTTFGLLPLLSAAPATRSLELLPYAPQYPHQAHGYELASTRLLQNPAGRDWLAAADRALTQPVRIELPYAKAGERARSDAALGYAFTVPVGRRVSVKLTRPEDDFLPRDCRVLVIGKDEAQRNFICDLIASWGMTFAVTDTASRALTLCSPHRLAIRATAARSAGTR